MNHYEQDVTDAGWAQLQNEQERKELEDWLDDYDRETRNQQMKFEAKSTSNFKLVPEGNHVAICYQVIDLGLQPGSEQYPKPKHQVRLTFELPDEQLTYEKDGNEVEGPMSIGTTFTASMHENANLRHFVESWFGKKFPSDEAASDFEFSKLAGYKCLLNVVHTSKGGKTYANIQTATPIPKGMKSEQKQVNQSVVYSLDDPEKGFDLLPEWLQKKIEGRLDDVKDSVEPLEDEPFVDEIPFN